MFCFLRVKSFLPCIVCREVFQILARLIQACERNPGQQGRPASYFVEGEDIGIAAVNDGTSRGICFGSISYQ